MKKDGNVLFLDKLQERSEWMRKYILSDRFVSRFKPADIEWAVTAYVRYGGKRLRPAILLFSCGAMGGDERIAIPAAAAVEIFHTWTLVHDDIIDRDDTRRGSSTIHSHYAQLADHEDCEMVITHSEARHYGHSVAILTGDIQHGWGISMMTELTTVNGVDPKLTLELINDLDTKVLNTLVEGEVLDIQFAYMPVDKLTPEQIEDMLWKKTGALYEFCGRAGAMIGSGEGKDNPHVKAVANFAAKCGTAFQLQDDILGIIGDEKKLGKPVGSDLREGKRTLVIYHAFQNATAAQREKMVSVLGDADASEDKIKEVITLLRDLDGIDWVNKRADGLIQQAREHLEFLPPSEYRDLLWQWSEFMINREF